MKGSGHLLAIIAPIPEPPPVTRTSLEETSKSCAGPMRDTAETSFSFSTALGMLARGVVREGREEREGVDKDVELFLERLGLGFANF